MTNDERARELADHCRYCDRLDNPHPALKCAQDREDNIREIALALDEAEKRGMEALLERPEIRFGMCNECAKYLTEAVRHSKLKNA